MNTVLAVRIALFSLAVPLALAAFPARADIGAGSWELEITTVMPGAPKTPVKQVQCMSAEDAKDPANLIGGPGPGCTFGNRRDDGSTFRFDVACTSGAPLSGSGELHYARESLNGEIVVHMKQGDKQIEVHSLLKARRLGPCR
ncbi:MAG TPA: DUF3617 family protein [Burkholderiales bacterium]